MLNFLGFGGELFRFGGVGIAATGVHAAVFVGLIEIGEISPLMANVIAFGVAVLLSFYGHLHWTFRQKSNGASAQKKILFKLVKFVVIAIVGLTLNTIVIYVFTEALAQSYLYALLLMVSVVPMVVFFLSKYWAFG